MQKQTKTLVVIVAFVAMLAGFWFGQQQDHQTKPEIQGFVIDPPRRLGTPELRQADGAIFSKHDLSGHWSLMFYGYTNCPDICPTTLNTLATAKKKSLQSGKVFPRVVFVSVDPVRDDVDLIDEYVRYFDEDFIGVTGEEKMLQAMASQMSVAAIAMPSDDPEEYKVDHSANLMLLNPRAELVAIMRPPHSVESILETLQTVVADR